MEKIHRKKRLQPNWTDSERYPCRLQLYSNPPKEEVTLENFEKLALHRLKGLKAIESARLKYPKRDCEFEEAMRKVCKQYFSLQYCGVETNLSEGHLQERKEDNISHFILRLAYCRTEELRRWFLSQETELFRYRFLCLEPSEKLVFMKTSGLDFSPIGDDEKGALLAKLASSCSLFGYSAEVVSKTQYFKVLFEEALELVRGRRVYVENGFAYVPFAELVHILCGAFRLRVSAALMVTSKALPSLEEDERLLPMLVNLSRQYLGQDYSSQGGAGRVCGKISSHQLDALSATSFPLCMRNLHQHLRKTHHLKHGGRMQYGLFLKGIGISLEDALLFWKGEFSKGMSGDKFDKSYSYNIRHNYGKEGKRSDYTPYSCMKIIMSNSPGAGEQHGCPFKHSDADALRGRLMEAGGFGKGQVEEMLELVRNSHYQLACAKYFEGKHGASAASFELNHPNQYFSESYRLLYSSAAVDGDGGVIEK
eukprot:Sdes_comp15114_c0_seq1m3920